MSKKVMGAWGVAILVAALAGPAVAGDNGRDWVWCTDGKRWSRIECCVEPVVMPTTRTVEVAPADRRPGDVLGYKYVGKRTERVYFREVPIPAPEPGHLHSWHLESVGKQVVRVDTCSVNGVEQEWLGFDAEGRCLSLSPEQGLEAR